MKVQPRLDPDRARPKRLQLCAILAAVDEGEFARLRDAVGVSDSVLSKQLKRNATPAQAMPQLPGSAS